MPEKYKDVDNNNVRQMSVLNTRHSCGLGGNVAIDVVHNATSDVLGHIAEKYLEKTDENRDAFWDAILEGK